MENAYAVSRFLLSGSGGQGVITMAILLAEAAVKYEGLVAVQSQSYGPEARGGATRSDVILSHKAIYYPKVEQPNILVALTDAACAKYLPLIRPGGLCIYDTELVHPGRKVGGAVQGPAALGRGQGTPRFGGFVQRGRARSARDADRERCASARSRWCWRNVSRRHTTRTICGPCILASSLRNR